MQTSNPTRFVTVEDRELSLWQSAVAEHVKKQLVAAGKPSHATAVRAHPMMQAVNAHVLAEKKGEPIPRTGPSEPYTAHRSRVAFYQAFPQRAPGAADSDARSPADSNIAEWLAVFVNNSALVLAGDTPQYLDCNGNMSFGMIPWQLPDDAKVIVLGDFGSGNQDAVMLLTAAIVDAGSRLAALIHLGDVYYSGQPAECTDNIVNVVAQAFQAAKVAPVPMFWVPGNHEYYSMGAGFYATFPLMSAGNSQAVQSASYFCLRTAGGDWQFLGMDTGQSDYIAGHGVTGAVNPTLRPSEIAWHQDKLNPANFKGSTILLSHHQLFSANCAVTDTGSTPWINGALWSTFQPSFNSIALWLWGHEHNQQLFYPGSFGLAKGRLVGASAYEEATDDSGLTAVNPLVQLGSPAALTPSDGYFNHGYAVIDLVGKGQQATISYHAFPSWDSDETPKNPVATAFAKEDLVAPAQMSAGTWPPATNLMRYVPAGMTTKDKCRLSVSSTGATGSWTVLDQGVQLIHDLGPTGIAFKGEKSNVYSLSIEIKQPTAGSAPTCSLNVAFAPAKGSAISFESGSAVVQETTQLQPGGVSVLSSFQVVAGSNTVAISSYPNDTPNIGWDPHVLFIIQGNGGAVTYLAIEDQTLG